MKRNQKSIAGSKKLSSELKSEEPSNEDYDKSADFYYSNLINALILFTFKTDKLEKLEGPAFNPMFELETEIDYAFLPACFDTIFRNGLINASDKSELLSFKKKVDEVPEEIWKWELLDNHDTWVELRKEADKLLNKLGCQVQGEHTRISP